MDKCTPIKKVGKVLPARMQDLYLFVLDCPDGQSSLLFVLCNPNHGFFIGTERVFECQLLFSNEKTFYNGKTKL